MIQRSIDKSFLPIIIIDEDGHFNDSNWLTSWAAADRRRPRRPFRRVWVPVRLWEVGDSVVSCRVCFGIAAPTAPEPLSKGCTNGCEMREDKEPTATESLYQTTAR